MSAEPSQVVSSRCYAGDLHGLESHRLDRLEKGALALGCPLNSAQLERFDIYRAELLNWNLRINLTSITDPVDIEVLHFLDSLTLVAALPIRDQRSASLSLLDIGSGAGFPGIPLKIALPDLRVSLLEATGKKAAFMEHIVNVLGLGEVTVLKGRAEDLGRDGDLRESFDVTAVRAVGQLAVLAELCLPFTNVNGRFIAMKKGSMEEEVRAASAAIATLGGSTAQVLPVRVDGLDDERSLITVDKIKPTPARFPRRPGMPSKRPLGWNPRRIDSRGNTD